MRKLRILGAVLKATHADKILFVFIAFTFISALVIMLFEPEINTYGDSLWYCYTVIFTIGFGSLEASTIVGKLLSVVLSVYNVFVVAIVTGVVVSFYQHYIHAKYEFSIENTIDKLEHLDTLSKDELKKLSEKLKKFK